MKFSKITINNFRQYYGTIDIDLTTNEDKNIILIGGKNGYGKTNFLLSVVWCLYGSKISQIDDNFKKEIKKEKNYSSFIQQSINWTAKKENKNTFSVSILVSEIESQDYENGVLISRTFNIDNGEEKISITDPISNIELFDNDDDKINFINDYIIPIEAAKFVFFDAEKISDIANLSIAEEGKFINDALGKILGLDVYDTLIDDLKNYINNLKKNGATRNLQEQIINSEKGVEITKLEIEKLEERNGELQRKIDGFKKDIRNYDDLISQNSKQGNLTSDRTKITRKIDELKDKETELSNRFNKFSEIIPLAILIGNLEEVKEHLEVQNENEISQLSLNENTEKIENFIESLFNKPPEPENSTMSLKDKLFYYEKAKDLSFQLFGETKYKELDFEYDLNNAEKDLISKAINLVNSQSKDLFETTIRELNETTNELEKLNKKLYKIDIDLEDDLILEYISKKEITEYKITECNRGIGVNNQKIAKLNEDIIRYNQNISQLMRKVTVNKKNEQKIQQSQKYIDVLNVFIEEQKRNHKNILEKNILNELKMLMHKLNHNTEDEFIEDVMVTILASGQGMKITLLNQDDDEIRKESLSSGEKQIYISCLIKAILKESIQDLPIFIDTPLGRLDEEHRDSITKKYYPTLSKQVVLFSTNSEITPKRYKEITNNISKSYLLESDGNNTKLNNGYFNTRSND